ncbi:hypothetical protein MRX96_016486 [Rhipicephalus microplus]
MGYGIILTSTRNTSLFDCSWLDVLWFMLSGKANTFRDGHFAGASPVERLFRSLRTNVVGNWSRGPHCRHLEFI